jgi:hypothetical protein
MARIGLLCLACALIALVACHSRDSRYKEPVVVGFLAKDATLDQLTYEKEVDVVDYDGLRMVPEVLLNGSEIGLLSFSAFECDYGDTNSIPVNQDYDIEVRHYWGNGTCHLVMPGDFGLGLPIDRYILGQDSTLVSNWRRSSGAQWYWVSVFANYDYYDTLGGWDNYTFTLDTLVTDTVLALPPERLFPQFVGEVIDGDGSVTVQAGFGPANEPGDVGNVRGSALGFVSAVNTPADRYFYVGSPTSVRRAPDGRGQQARLKAVLRGRLPSH